MPSPSAGKTEHPWIARSRAAGRPLVFAHRGGAALAPENTLAAFTRAHTLGVDGFELDVRLSRDGEVMVIHDADVDRTTNGKGRVSALTSDELRRLDAGCRFKDPCGNPVSGEEARDDTRIPLLRDILARFPDEMLIVELKGANPALPPRAFEIVRQAGALERVCFGGFQRHMLIGVRRCGRRHTSDRPSDRRSASVVCSSASREETRWSLYRSWVHLPWPWRPYDAFQVPEISKGTRVVSPEFVRAAHARDLLVQVWTVNDEPSMTRLLEWGVDGLITDRPDLALRARDAFVSASRSQAQR
jgi:glycerophosphoryl diester phosphodiesterase